MNKINYAELAEITVESQEELEMIPDDFAGRIFIEFGTPWSPAIVKKSYEGSVEAWGNSSVVAWGNSSIVARGNSSVVASGNSQITNFQPTEARIQISGNSRIVYNPITIDEYVSFYGIEHDEKTGHFFKAVHRSDDGYFYSDHDPDFRYIVGTTVHQPCDPNVGNERSYGIHITHLDLALDFGATWSNLAIIEVETDLDKVVVPVTGDGKVRTSEVKVLREVPLKECGAYGEMLARCLGQNKPSE